VETAGYRGRSRRQEPKGKAKKEKKNSHFRTVRFGGFDENQMICYLWDIVKYMEAAQADGNTCGAENGCGTDALARLEKQMRSQIRVEIRRYFVRRKRRNVKMVCKAAAVLLGVAAVFVFLIGVDRVSGDSMYPYLNHGDWIVYSRMGKEHQRDEVVVFEKNGECMVKRIAGLPGDKVEINSSGSCVVINGTQVRENYMTLVEPEPGEAMGIEQMVMDGQYLVLGDNRGVSIDSRNRSIGTVAAEQIRGKVILVVRVRG